MPTYCDKCEEVIDRPEEVTRVGGDDLCLNCLPENRVNDLLSDLSAQCSEDREGHEWGEDVIQEAIKQLGQEHAPEPLGDSTIKAIYDNLPNPCEIGTMISRLAFDESKDMEHDIAVMKEAGAMLNDHLDKFHNIMQVANKLAGKENA